MSYLSRSRKYLGKAALPALIALMHVSLLADPVTMKSTVSPDGSNYLYDLAISNLSSSDPYAILVDFSLSLPVGSILGNPAAPTGYGAFADPGSGYLQFSAAGISGFPLNLTVDGFQFLSPLQFGTLSFGASYLDSTETTATMFSGMTSPVSSPAVPEPQTLGLLALASVLVGCWLLLNRGSKRFAPSQD